MVEATYPATPLALPDLGAARQAKTAWLLALPAVILMIAFILAPLAAVVFLDLRISSLATAASASSASKTMPNSSLIAPSGSLCGTRRSTAPSWHPSHCS